MEGIMTILTLAVTVEALVEYGKSIGRAVLSGAWKQTVSRLSAMIGGVAVCFAANADLFSEMGLAFAWPWLGQLLTGLLISRGANYVSDFMQKIADKKEVK